MENGPSDHHHMRLSAMGLILSLDCQHRIESIFASKISKSSCWTFQPGRRFPWISWHSLLEILCDSLPDPFALSIPGHWVGGSSRDYAGLWLFWVWVKHQHEGQNYAKICRLCLLSSQISVKSSINTGNLQKIPLPGGLWWAYMGAMAQHWQS